MDDKEYYSLMNKMPSSYVMEDFLRQQAKKKRNEKQKLSQTYNGLQLRQGREDAQMLKEKEDNSI